jgi:flagellar motor component MotA
VINEAFERVMENQISGGNIENFLMRIDNLTLINSLSNCSCNIKEKVLCAIPKYIEEYLSSDIDRISGRVLFEDVIKAQEKIIEVANEYDKLQYVIIDDIEHFHFNPEALSTYNRHRIIPNTMSLDYNGFIKSYYDLLWFLYICDDVSRKAGILALEEYLIDSLEDDDFVGIGLRRIVSYWGNDMTDLIFFNKISRDNDPYKKRLKQIALVGLHAINDSKYTPNDLMILLNDFGNIHDGWIDKASEDYRKGDKKIFNKIFKKDSPVYIRINTDIEREEIALTRRVLEFQGKARREGFKSMKEIISNKNIISNKDANVLEYGAYLISIGYKKNRIRRTIDKIIKLKKHPLNMNFYQAQKQSILAIRDGCDSRILFEILLSYFTDDIAVTARKIFKDI